MRLAFVLFLITWNYCLSQTQSAFFGIDQIVEVDENSVSGASVDVLHLFSEDELPNVFRLGGLLLRPFYFDNEVVKLELTYNGDRETIIETYYFDNQKKVFFVKCTYQFYTPPKWEESSKLVLEEKSNYFFNEDELKPFKAFEHSKDNIIHQLQKLDILFNKVLHN